MHILNVIILAPFFDVFFFLDIERNNCCAYSVFKILAKTVINKFVQTSKKYILYFKLD